MRKLAYRGEAKANGRIGAANGIARGASCRPAGASAMCSNIASIHRARERVVSGARHVAVWIAAIAFFVLGAIWYTVLSARWLAAIGKTTDQMTSEQGGSPLPYVIGFVAILVMCYTLAWLIERLQATTFAGGMGLG